jgi:hypothetical protein
MLLRKFFLLAAVPALALPLLLFSQQPEKLDLEAIHKLKAAEFGTGGRGGGRFGGGGRSQAPVMNTMYNLTDRYGPRLTNSPQFRAAGDWAVSQLNEWGLANVHLEPFATAGLRGGAIPSWEMKYYYGAMVEPTYMPIIGYPQAWTGSTNGVATGEAIIAQNSTDEDMKKWHGKLQGKFVLIAPLTEGATSAALPLDFPLAPLAHRYSDSELAGLVQEIIPGGPSGGRGGRGSPYAAYANMTPEERQAFQEKQANYWKDEGVLGTITASARGESGTVFASNGGPRTGDPTRNIPAVAITAENYNRIVRLVEHDVPVKLSFDIRNEFDMSKTEAFNVIAEIPGGSKPNELVMVGGHFDSWHMGTGATDNGAGAALAMEVARLLKTTGLKMDRTVRMALWGGEEQGLFGSQAYVKAHFADPATMKPTPEHDAFAGYFNIDNGTGRIRGIYLQSNEQARPVFEAWFATLKDLTPGVVTARNTGGTDHQSFDAVGLPGFQFIQDEMDYDTRTHHSNMDVYDRIQEQDMRQMAVIEAVFVYNAATRADKLPRKELPAPQPTGGRGRGGL